MMNLTHGTIEQVSDGLYVATPNPGEGTMGVVVSACGKVAIDTSAYVPFASNTKRTIDSKFPGPWRYVVTTHSHFDHIGGNIAFSAPIIASSLTESYMSAFTPEWIEENTNSWLEKGLLDERLFEKATVRMPDILYEEKLTLRLDDVSLQIMRLGGHSVDSSVVYIPERRALFAADLVFNGKPAATTEADLKQWQQSLRQLQELPLDFVIAGHGPPGGPELLTQQLAEIDDLIAANEATNEA